MRTIIFVFFCILGGLQMQLAQGQTTIRINAGGPAYTDPAGNSWIADKYSNTGNAYSTGSVIKNTPNPKIYQTERWGSAAPNPELQYNIPLINGAYTLRLHFAEIYGPNFALNKRVFNVAVQGTAWLTNFDIFKEAGGGNTALIEEMPVNVSNGNLNISFTHVIQNPKISAIEIIPSQTGDVNAHAVITPVEGLSVIDLNSDGFEAVKLDGTKSHTHLIGGHLVSWIWSEGLNVLASTEVATVTLPIGVHTITLTVTDSGGNTHSVSAPFTVLKNTGVPGLIGYYYNFGSTSLSAMPVIANLKPTWGEIESTINFPSTTGSFAKTPYLDHFTASYIGYIDVPTNGTILGVTSDDGSKVFIDNALVINNDGTHSMRKMSSTPITAGKHSLRIEFFENIGGAGLILDWTLPGQTAVVVPNTAFTHDYTQSVPVVQALSPTSGPPTGNNVVRVSGFGFVYPNTQTAVSFGSQNVASSSITIVDQNTIDVVAPSGAAGTVQLSVTTPSAESNGVPYLYSSQSLPAIQFTQSTIASVTKPTALAFAPDGKTLYVAQENAMIMIYKLNPDHTIASSFSQPIIINTEPTTPGILAVLGIAINPFDDPANPKLYVSVSRIYHHDDANYYRYGKVVILSGPNLDIKNDLITNLPVSDHDHAVNGIVFGNDGKMYIHVGSNTNAGIPGSLSKSGKLDEGALSAAVLVANITQPGFDGLIMYDAQGHQINGDVSVFGAGLRNSFNGILHSNGNYYATCNGPNGSFGAKSTSCTTQGLDPNTADALFRVFQGGYYGHPDRLRGEIDPRQCIWHGPTEPTANGFISSLTTFPSSTDGIAEYFANTFGGQLRTNLIISQWNGGMFVVTLSADGTSALSNKKYPTLSHGGLNTVVGPDGTIYVVDQQQSTLISYVPNEPAPTGLTITSAFPQRGPLGGNRPVLITGAGFTPTTSVTIGGKPCTITSRNGSTEIVCTTPTATVGGPVSVQLNNGTTSTVLDKSYIYLSR